MAAGVGGRKVPERMVVAMKARELGRKGIVVGDDVGLVGDSSGHPDALARIVRVEPRRTVLPVSYTHLDVYKRQAQPAPTAASVVAMRSVVVMLGPAP